MIAICTLFGFAFESFTVKALSIIFLFCFIAVMVISMKAVDDMNKE